MMIFRSLFLATSPPRLTLRVSRVRDERAGLYGFMRLVKQCVFRSGMQRNGYMKNNILSIKFFRNFFCFLNLILVSNLILADDNTNQVKISSRACLWPRMPFYPTTPETLPLNRTLLEPYQQDQFYQVYFTPYFSQTGHHDDLGSYFLPNGKSSMICGEFGCTAAYNGTLDVLANYFNVFTNAIPITGDPISLQDYRFESLVKFKPKQTMVGTALTYHQHLSEYLDEGFWWEFIIPLLNVTNDLQVSEDFINTGTGPTPDGYYNNMIEAFQQPGWYYGKIDDSARSAFGIADIQVKLGYTYNKTETHAFSTYWGIILPTGNTPDAEWMFEPVVGNNGHMGLYSAASLFFRVWHSEEMGLYWTLDTAGIFFGENKQMRSFDLKGKPWSRYMSVYADYGATSVTPGINIFTQSMNVTPGAQRDLNLGFLFKNGGFRGEFGYHVFCRAQEIVKLAGRWDSNAGIAAIYDSNIGNMIAGGATRDQATINTYGNITNDQINASSTTAKFLAISEDQIDLNSAAMAGTFLNTFYVTLNYYWADRPHPVYLAGGGSFDMKTDNTAPAKWAAWFNLGLEF